MNTILIKIAQAVKPLSQRSFVILSTISIISIASLSVVLFTAVQGENAASIIPEETTPQEYDTISPVLVSASSSTLLLGTVLSNETANIYPRRDGIIEDILVDIGDSVKKNQVVAVLLPKGVEGQSAAMIGEKLARKSQAESDVQTAQQVAEETIINTRQKVIEKETEMKIAKNQQKLLLKKFKEYQENIYQMQEQAFTAAQSAKQLIEWVILGSNTRTGIEIREYDLGPNLGLHDSSNSVRYVVTASFNALSNALDTYAKKSKETDDVLQFSLQAITDTNTLLQFTPTQPTANGITQYSHEQLADRIGKITAAQDMLYKAKEKLDDARNSFITLVSSEPELYQAFRTGSTENVEGNAVRMLEEQIRTANNVLELTEANQNQMIERQRTMVDIADAMLQSEYATSGNREIRSPFSGIVSKRFITVGQIVMPSMSAFELTGVPTSLAKIAKTEVQFGLPEKLIDAVSVGDTISFFLQTDETKIYTAQVVRKSPQVDAQTHTVTIQAKVDDTALLPHRSSVRIRLIDQNAPIFRLPSTAVKREKDTNYIWLLKEGTNEPIQQAISVIAEDGEFAEFTGDISVQSQILRSPPTISHD